MLFRQLFDQDSSTYTYLLADEQSGEAVLIDPVIEQFERDRTLIEELQLKLLYVLETHVHADHVTGAWLLKRDRQRPATRPLPRQDRVVGARRCRLLGPASEARRPGAVRAPCARSA